MNYVSIISIPYIFQRAIFQKDPYTVQVFGGIPEGHTLPLSGELLYAFQCQPVMVDVTESSVYHQDLPAGFRVTSAWITTLLLW